MKKEDGEELNIINYTKHHYYMIKRAPLNMREELFIFLIDKVKYSLILKIRMIGGVTSFIRKIVI